MKLPNVLRRCQRGLRTFSSSATRTHREKPPFNILFFGTDSFAVKTLQALHTNRLAVPDNCVVDKLHVVSTSEQTAVAEFARQQNIALLPWPLELNSLDLYDLGVLVSFGRLVPRKVISKFPHGILNVHPSLLPRWRGASPIMHTVLNGDAETGVSIMSIQPKRFDTGPLLQQKRLPVPDGCTAEQLSHRLAREGAELLVASLWGMPDILHNARPQKCDGVTYAHKASASMAVIDWQQHSSRQIQLQYRALAHMFPLRTSWNGKTVKLTEMLLDTDEGFEPSSTHIKGITAPTHRTQGRDAGDAACHSEDRSPGLRPGTVVFDQQRQAICVKCMEGWAAFSSVTLKKRMSAADFHNGYLSKDKHKDVCFQSQHNGLFSSQYWDFVTHPKSKKS